MPSAGRASQQPWSIRGCCHADALHIDRVWPLMSPSGVDVNRLSTPENHVGCIKGFNFSQNVVTCVLLGFVIRSRGVSAQGDFFIPSLPSVFI